MHTMAYLSGFPGSLKETEQLRVKLPAVVTSKIKQVKRLNWDNQYNAIFEMTTRWRTRLEKFMAVCVSSADNFKAFIYQQLQWCYRICQIEVFLAIKLLGIHLTIK